MKAVHVKSSKVYSVKDIISGQITLISAKTGDIRKVTHEHFEKFFTLKDDEEVKVSNTNTVKKETVEAKKRASEVLSELEDENTDPTPKKVRTGKPRKPKQDKEPQERVSGKTTTTLKQICSDNSIDPAKARRILRKHEIPKPYEWSDPSPIIKLLKK